VNTAYIVRYVYESKHSPLMYQGTMLIEITQPLPYDPKLHCRQWDKAIRESRPVGDYFYATGQHGYYSMFSVLSSSVEVDV
jgi:hypothetical protein